MPSKNGVPTSYKPKQSALMGKAGKPPAGVGNTKPMQSKTLPPKKSR